MPYSLEKLYF